MILYLCANIFYFRVNQTTLELLESILQIANIWLANILRGYWITALLLVVTYWVLRRERHRFDHYLDQCNRLYVFLATFAMAGYLAEMLYGWFGPNGQDYKVFIGYRVLGPWKWVFWTAFAGAYVLPQLYWWKRMRTRPLFIILVILMMHIDNIVEYVSKSYREYYSMWWSFGPQHRSLITYMPLLIFPAILYLYISFRGSGSKES